MVLRHVLVVGCMGAVVAIGCGGGTATTISDPGAGDGGGDGAAASAEGGGGGSGGGFADGGGGPGGNTTSVPCGANSCSLATEVCCVVDRNGVVTYQCATGTCGSLDAGAGGGDVVSLKCTAQANCGAGTICCIDQPGGGGGGGGGDGGGGGGGGGGGAIASSCVAGTMCPNGAQLCDPSAASSGCPAGGKNSVCSSDNIGDWGLTPPFATCGGVGN